MILILAREHKQAVTRGDRELEGGCCCRLATLTVINQSELLQADVIRHELQQPGQIGQGAPVKVS